MEKRYDQLSIDADHSDMTKFSHSQNQDFLTIRERLIELVEDAPEAIKKRFGPRMQQSRRTNGLHVHVLSLRKAFQRSVKE